MFGESSNAQRFFARVGGLSFPPPAELLTLTVQTLGLVIAGTVLAAVLSVPVAYLAASNTTPGRTWMGLARFVGVFTRAIPDVVLAMVFVLMFSLGALPGILAIGIHSIGMISKLFADAIEQIDEGPRLAIRATGGSRWQEFSAGILPQVMPSWVATVLHRNDINLRGSVILGYVGVAGLGLAMSNAFKSLDYSLGLGIALVIFLLCVLMEIVSSAVRVSMLGDQAGKGGLVKLMQRRRAAAGGARLRNRQGPTADAGHTTSGTNASGTFASPIAASPTEALKRPWTGRRIKNVLAGWTAVAVVVAAVLVSDITWGDFLTFWREVPPVAASFWPPNFGSYGFSKIFAAMLDTSMIALAATLIAFVFSLLIGSLAARNVAPTHGTRNTFRR